MDIEAFKIRMEKDRQVKEWLYPKYEHLELRGAVLIDGHHVFLNIIRSVQKLRRNPESFMKTLFPESQDLSKPIALATESEIFQHHPRRIARIYGECVLRICDYANEKFKEDVLGDVRAFLPIHKLGIPFELKSGDVTKLDPIKVAKAILAEHPPEDFIVTKTAEQRWIFDATMPDQKEVKKNLEKNYQYWNGKDKGRSNNLNSFLTTMERGNWGFFENQIRGSIVVPYDLKNKVLEALEEKDWMFGEFNLHTQVRKISGFNGFVESREKGVDTKLVIKGCELAESNKIDWVWLVTSDGDHAPLIEHLKAKGKEVFLTSLSYPSNALLHALNDRTHYLHFDERS